MESCVGVAWISFSEIRNGMRCATARLGERRRLAQTGLLRVSLQKDASELTRKVRNRETRALHRDSRTLPGRLDWKGFDESANAHFLCADDRPLPGHNGLRLLESWGERLRRGVSRQ